MTSRASIVPEPHHAAASPCDEPSSPVRLVVRNGCKRLLTWDCEFADRRNAGVVLERLATFGYVDVSRFEKVRELLHPDGHAVVVVPATGRVQIRISYLTPFDAREAAARDVGAHLTQAVQTSERP